MKRLGKPNIANHESGDFLQETELLFRIFEPRLQLFEAGHQVSLSQIRAGMARASEPAEKTSAHAQT